MRQTTATNARKEFFEMIKGATEKHEIFHIHHRKGGVVLMSDVEYEGLLETLELLSTPGFKERIERSLTQFETGEVYSMEDVFGTKKQKQKQKPKKKKV